MAKSRFDIVWVGYCEPTSKIWGYFRDRDGDHSSYAFFAHVKHTITLKKFTRFASGELNNIVKKKISNKYIEVKFKDLIELWPDFITELENKFTFDKLAERIKHD